MTGIKNPEWLACVRSLGECVRCGSTGCEPAHRNEGKGAGIKAPDQLTAALCRACHMELDQGKNLVREDRRNQMNAAIVDTIAALLDAGHDISINGRGAQAKRRAPLTKIVRRTA